MYKLRRNRSNQLRNGSKKPDQEKKEWIKLSEEHQHRLRILAKIQKCFFNIQTKKWINKN